MSTNPSTTKHPSHRIIALGLVLGNNSVLGSNQSYIKVSNCTICMGHIQPTGCTSYPGYSLFCSEERAAVAWPPLDIGPTHWLDLSTDRQISISHTNGQTNTPTVTNSRHQSCLMLQDIQVISLSDAHTFLTKNNKYSMMTNWVNIFSSAIRLHLNLK